MPDTRISTTLQFYIQIGEGPQFIITQHLDLAGKGLPECKAKSSDICVSDNMFGPSYGSDAYRIPSAETPLLQYKNTSKRSGVGVGINSSAV